MKRFPIAMIAAQVLSAVMIVYAWYALLFVPGYTPSWLYTLVAGLTVMYLWSVERAWYLWRRMTR